MDERENTKIERQKFKEILQEIRCNPKQGLNTFCDLYQTKIQATAQLICRCVHTANEVVNEVLERVWRFAYTGKSIKNPNGWVFTITLNAAKNTFRSRQELPLDENVAASQAETQDMIEKDAFYWYLQDLEKEDQIIIISRLIGRYTFQEIADAFGKPLSTVTSAYYRALDKIKIKLEKKFKK